MSLVSTATDLLLAKAMPSQRPSPARLASTIFQSGPNDVLAAVDAYTNKPTSVINSLVGKLSPFDTSILDGNLGIGDIKGKLGALFQNATASFSINSGDMLGRVSAIVGGSRGALSSMTGTIVGSLTQGLGLNAISAGTLAVSIGSVESRVRSNDPTSVSNFMGLVNTVAGDANLGSVLDVGAETSLLTGMVGQCISMGIPGAIAGIASNARSATALRSALQNNVVGALASGSLTALNTMLSQPGGRGIILSQAPNAASQLLKGYSLAPGTSPSAYASHATDLISTLSNIDPSWNKYSRNGSMISNLGAYSQASPDALAVLACNPDHQLAATVASDFASVTSMKGTAKSLYPYMQLQGA